LPDKIQINFPSNLADIPFMPELSYNQWEALKRDYAKGYNLHELERKYPISRTAIKDHLRRRGLLKSPKQAKAIRKLPDTDDAGNTIEIDYP